MLQVELDKETQARLDYLADTTKTSQAILVAQFLKNYLKKLDEHHLKAIKEGIDSADRGEFASYEEVKAQFSKWGVNIEG